MQKDRSQLPLDELAMRADRVLTLAQDMDNSFLCPTKVSQEITRISHLKLVIMAAIHDSYYLGYQVAKVDMEE